MPLTFVHMRLIQLLILIAAFFTFSQASAQVSGCIDSLHAQPTYPCPDAVDDYNPVCGCDGQNYRNSCVASNRYGVQYYSNGLCTDFDFYFTPNMVSDQLRYAYYSNTSGSLNIFIYNAMGYVVMELKRFAVPGYPQFEYIDTSQLNQGVYLLVMLKDANQQVKKFVKYIQ